ncbi:MAG: hypothetical protein INR68_03485 [Methylobacterium mesophilicum]|nr:hypothetical protein [Methylobacterium mesophilicum]
MGDLVQSERFSEPEALHVAFNAAVNAQNGKYAEIIASPLTITLGDEFQGLAKSLADAVSLVRDLRLQLLTSGIDCRFVIGSVDIKTALNTERAWNMMGPGLSRAREKLNEKRTTSLYRFSIASDPIIETTLDALGTGITVIERGWTELQLKNIAALLSGMTPADLAKLRQVSVHSIYKVRSSANFNAYVTLWSAMIEALAALDAREAAHDGKEDVN